ncbi:hypothetical protein CKAH01_01169 [Colletotrichum kahawae]|uniref:Uncharacterized protein n=1 Tax=Colletotrichum kahawae TaxID=34407 RepID=A0AAE0D3Y1_COLKA|nr:hypothetical protein CKAH01_01169 [Colletotrichum kahawae]
MADDTAQYPRASLGGIPPELFDHIASYLMPNIPPTPVMRPIEASYDIHTSAAQYEEWQWTRADLVSLYRTSKGIARASEPALLKTVALAKPYHLRRFLRLLTCPVKRGLGNYVRALYLLGDFQLGPRAPYFCLWRQLYNTKTLTDLAIVLTLTPYVAEFLVTSPNEKYFELLIRAMRHQMEYTHMMIPASKALTQPARYGLKLHSIAYEGKIPLTLTPLSFDLPFSCVRTLRLRHDFTDTDSDIAGDYQLPEAHRHHFSCNIPTYLSQLPNLEIFELLSDAPWCWRPIDKHRDDVTPPDYGDMPRMKKIVLNLSCIQEPELVGLLLACANLQTLAVYFSRNTHPHHFRRLPQGKDLNMALRGLSGSLRHLELVAAKPGNYLPSYPERSAGQRRRLDCLPFLTNVKTLVIDFTGLFGLCDFIHAHDVIDLPNRFPPNVQDLTIGCRWHSNPPLRMAVDYDDELRVVSALADCYNTTLQKLRRLTLDIPTTCSILEPPCPRTVASTSASTIFGANSSTRVRSLRILQLTVRYNEWTTGSRRSIGAGGSFKRA